LEKLKKYRTFYDRKPNRDLVRHKYFNDIPGYL